MTVSVPTDARLTFGGVLRSEWIKLVSLRSTVWCYVILVALTIGLGVLIAAAGPGAGELGVTGGVSGEFAQSSWLQSATLGVNVAQLVIAVLGALVITGEYGTGMIRSTFAAVPGRLPALAGKAVVFAITTFVVQFVAVVVTAFLTLPLLAAKDYEIDVADPAVWLGLVGAAGYIALIGLLALGLGTIIRASAGAIAAALGLLLVLPTVLQIVAAVTRTQWAADAGMLLPSSAGSLLYGYPFADAEVPDGFEMPADVIIPLSLEPWQGLLVLLAWVAVPLVLGAVLLKRRDS